jgi:acetyltransferase-like isoleucine patch superfamily enzyme
LASRVALVEPASVREGYERWVGEVAAAIDGPANLNGTVAQIGASLYAQPDARSGWKQTAEVFRAHFDPRSVTLEAEYYAEMDRERFYRVKPLLWLWRLFDRSILGPNVHLGLRFREMLARRVFARCGERPRIFEDVVFSFGYNVSVGDDVSIHRNVLIDDRGEVVLEDRASLSDYVNVYSHQHDPMDPSRVTLHRTVVREGARVTYHATVLAGTTVAREAIVGCHGVVTRDIGEHHIAVGVPAKSIRVKPRCDARDAPEGR